VELERQLLDIGLSNRRREHPAVERIRDPTVGTAPGSKSPRASNLASTISLRHQVLVIHRYVPSSGHDGQHCTHHRLLHPATIKQRSSTKPGLIYLFHRLRSGCGPLYSITINSKPTKRRSRPFHPQATLPLPLLLRARTETTSTTAALLLAKEERRASRAAYFAEEEYTVFCDV